MTTRWLLWLWLPLPLVALSPGWNDVEVRGVRQEVLFLAAKAPKHSEAILFLPGDGGYRGAAKEMSRAMADSGYDVCVWDTKRYLSTFTARDGQLREEQLGGDFASIRAACVSGPGRRVILAGWSQGAAMSAVAGASPEGRHAFAGVVLLALPDTGVLAWRWKDSVAALWRGAPGGPQFATETYLARIAPLPLAVIQAGRDHFTPASVSKRMLASIRRPHHLRTLEDAEHDFGPNRGHMYEELNRALRWIQRHERL
ncbi:MAG: hypothetical protein K2X03_19820 [Bryobacteraceae bacterium]|nr:hypothetical protein [Bryobacteraceae bacterium]